MFGTTEIMVLVGAAVLLFGVDKLPKLARSAGQAKKEFMVGQAEADLAAERAREEARRRASAETIPTADAAAAINGAGGGPIVPDPITGAPGPTTAAPPRS
jgi:sec-independent protein translocase protein TatA